MLQILLHSLESMTSPRRDKTYDNFLGVRLVFCHARALALTVTTSLVFSFVSSFAASGPSPVCRFWGVFVVPSLLRTLSNESVRLQERLKCHFLTKRAHSSPSPLEAPANSEVTEPIPDWKVRGGEERNMDVDLPDVSTISPLVVH
jgi:hypothetical protein